MDMEMKAKDMRSMARNPKVAMKAKAKNQGKTKAEMRAERRAEKMAKSQMTLTVKVASRIPQTRPMMKRD
jgi:hypothetical protein